MDLIIFYILPLIVLFILVLSKTSELIDRLVLYHERENLFKRIINVFIVYFILGIISFSAMYSFLTLSIVNSFFDNKNIELYRIIIITLVSTSCLLFSTRIISLWPKENCRDKIKHNERIASFSFSMIVTFLFSFILLVGIWVYLSPKSSIDTMSVLTLTNILNILLLWPLFNFILALSGETILYFKKVHVDLITKN